jgi:hypothetical protein
MWVPNDRNLYRLLTDWGGVIAGILALAAAWWTVRATRSTARDQIAAAQQQADKEIAANREAADREIAASREQIATTIHLERDRVAHENRAFCVMLEAAMARVLAETAWARKTYRGLITHGGGDPTREAFVVRTCITKSAFAELRAACVRLGSPLTGEFLDLEREIDSFASQWEETGPFSVGQPPAIRVGKNVGLGEQLASIEDKATALRKKAAEWTD